MKGTPSKGKHNKGETHMPCRRCGKRAYHKQKGECASCGYGKSKKIVKRNFMTKARNRK